MPTGRMAKNWPKKIPARLAAGIEISKGDFERRVMKQWT
jgi:hypothetical protein